MGSPGLIIKSHARAAYRRSQRAGHAHTVAIIPEGLAYTSKRIAVNFYLQSNDAFANKSASFGVGFKFDKHRFDIVFFMQAPNALASAVAFGLVASGRI